MKRTARTTHRSPCTLALALALALLAGIARAQTVAAPAEPAEVSALAEAARLVGAPPVAYRPSRFEGGYSSAITTSSEWFHPTERSFRIELQGPDARVAARYAGISVVERTAPWGGTLKEVWTPLWRPDERHEGQPIPGYLWWYWRYPRHLAALRASFPIAEGDVSLEAARAALQPVAEAMHRGVVAEGLDRLAPATVAGPYRVLIRVDALRPGDVLSPSVDVLDADGRPADDVRGVALLIDGRFANSVVWDGRRTTVEAQVSVGGQAVVEQLVVPAWDAAAAPPPAVAAGPLGAVGALPPPGSLQQTLVGMLAPPLLGWLAGVAGSLRGAGTPQQPGPRSPRPPAPTPSAKPIRREPSPPEADPELDRGRRTLDHLAEVARRTHDSRLDAAVAAARANSLGPDGRLDPAAWQASQATLRAALGTLHQGMPAPNSALSDAARALGGAGREFAAGVGQGLWGIAGGIGDLARGGWSGLGHIAEAIMNPRAFERGLREVFRGFSDRNLAEERQAFVQALRAGEFGAAVKSLGQGFMKTAGQLAGVAWDYARREILPWQELRAFTDPHASLEEKLWAIPATAAKVAGILTIFERPTTAPSTRWGRALHDVADRHAARELTQASAQASRRVGQLEQQLAALRSAGGDAPNATVRQMLERTQKALDQARVVQQSASCAQQVELLARNAMRGEEALQDFEQAQRVLQKNPQLTQAVDDAIRANQGGNALYDLRARGLIGEDAHTLMTARKLQLQDQALNAATKRIIEKEVEALQALGHPVPRRFHTFNATQGSRSRISGSNVQADLDQTVIGLGHVSREEAERIIEQECRRLGTTRHQLDINIYRPGQGLMDTRGAAPNAQATLENIGQTTGTAGHHPVHVDRKGNVHVGDHVSTPQGREGVLAGRGTMDPPPGMSREQWLREGVWEGFEGKPVAIPAAHWPQVRATQLEGIGHAFERGDMNQMVKYANRARGVGFAMDDATIRLVRTVAGQKDPARAAAILREAGVGSPAELMRRLGLKH